MGHRPGICPNCNGKNSLLTARPDPGRWCCVSQAASRCGRFYGVPRGKIRRHHWTSRHIYPGVGRDYWLYIPQQYDGASPAYLMVFQHGADYLGPKVNTATVCDNLIRAQEIPVTIGLFANPGDKGPGTPVFGDSDNRSFEYDSLDDRYARFLLEELLPEIQTQVSLVADPAGRAICGMSAGGICAFTVAWEHPEAFSKVVSHCGSFVDFRGGHNVTSRIRQTPPKPLRIFLQSGSRDLDLCEDAQRAPGPAGRDTLVHA